MDISVSAWFVMVLALLGANLPFLNNRLFALIPVSRFSGGARKPVWLCLIELICLYMVVGAIAYALETRIGDPAPQRWEFFAVTAFLFVVLAYPGFVFRYLRKRHP